MEGNAWRETGGNTFTTVESAVNYFSPLDQYLMGLRSSDEVGGIEYLETNGSLKQLLRDRSPASGFAMTATRKRISLARIIEREGPRIPDVESSQKEFRVAFIVLTEKGTSPSNKMLEKIAVYRDSLVEYFSLATGRRGSLNTSLN
jgi:hypothetical protein